MEFTLEQAMRAQSVLRAQAGLSAKTFSPAAIVGMLSDEIEALRTAGRSDVEIAKAISLATGAIVTERDVRDHYSTSEDRQHGP